MNDSNFDSLIGNKKNIEYFNRLIENGKLSHAYMIVGPKQSGKNTFVNCIIKKMILKYDSYEFLTRAKNGLCPDIITIDLLNDKKSIGIDQIRDGLKDMQLTPFELSFKVYIIKNAHLMTAQAQNAMLKSIEEPNDDVYFFLLTTNASLLLPTINSRVQKINIEVFSNEEMFNILANKMHIDKDDGVLRFASKFSNGSIGYAIKLVEENSTEYRIYGVVKKIIEGLSSRGVNYSFFDFILDIDSTYKTSKRDKSEQRNSFNILLSFLMYALRDILTFKMSNEPTLIFFEENEILVYSQSFSTLNIQKCISCISKLESESRFNYNVSTAAKYLSVNLWHNMN